MGVVEQLDSGGEIVIRRHRASVGKGEHVHGHGHGQGHGRDPDSGRDAVRVLELLDQCSVVQSMTTTLWRLLNAQEWTSMGHAGSRLDRSTCKHHCLTMATSVMRGKSVMKDQAYYKTLRRRTCKMKWWKRGQWVVIASSLSGLIEDIRSRGWRRWRYRGERGQRRIDNDFVCSEEIWIDSDVGSWIIVI